MLNFRRKSPNLLNAAPLSGRLELQVWTFSAASAAPEKAAGNRLEARAPHTHLVPVRGEGVMWRQLYIHFGRFLYVWTFSFSNKIKNKIRWQAQIQIQIKIKTRGNSIVYILYYIYYVIYLNKSEDVECCLFTSMFHVSTHQMGFHHRENVNVQHFKICKNLTFTLSPTQTWVIPCQICMFFLDPLIKCYFCVLSSKLGPLWCLSGKCGHPCPFMRPSSIMGTF